MPTVFKFLPTQEEVQHSSVGEVASYLYDTYDTALPQHWVNAVTALGYDPRGKFVWNYDQVFLHGRNTFGVPGPLFEEAARWINEHEEKVLSRLRRMLST